MQFLKLELTERDFSFQKEDESAYRANLENIRRNAERDQDEGVVTRFVDHVLGFSGGHPPWDDARTLLFWSAEPTTADLGDSIHVGISDEVARVLSLTNEDQSKVTWVTPDRCERWGVTIDEACSAATINQDRLLDGIELDAARGSDRLDTLGMIPVHPPYKASAIFAASFKKLVEPEVLRVSDEGIEAIGHFPV